MPITKNSEGQAEVSLYQDKEASANDVAVAMSRLKASFPKMGGEFFNILAERILIRSFSSKRLQDAVNNVIDNFKFKELNVADVVNFDKKVKLYTYNEVLYLINRGLASFEDFETREINGKIYRVKKTDLIW